MVALGTWLRRQGTVTTAPLRQVVVPLVAKGVQLLRPDGSIFKYRGITAFRSPELYAAGEYGWLEDYYGWAAELGANTLRVFCMWNNTKYWPHSRADYYDQLWDCCEHAKKGGFYVHLVCFCDQVEKSDVLLTREDQDLHIEQCLGIASATDNIFIEIENETFKNGGNAHASRFPSALFTDVLAMRSTWQDGEDPSLGGWLSLATKHLDRTFDWPRKGKTLHEAQCEGLGEYPPARIPSLSGEPERIGGGTTPRQHADNAAVCELMGVGGLLHGGYSSFDPSHDSDLQNCRVPGPGVPLDCARAVGDVWKSDVWDPRVGSTEHLTRGTENNDGPCPTVHWDRYNNASPNNHPNDGLCRTYYKLLEGKYYGLGVDPAPQWPGYQTREGWRIVAQGGYAGVHGGNMLRLER
jgi:hypothetical protein